MSRVPVAFSVTTLNTSLLGTREIRAQKNVHSPVRRLNRTALHT